MGKRRAAHPTPSGPGATLHGSVAVAEADLHGMVLSAAVARVDVFLGAWVHRQAGAVVRVICGKGNRSSGRAVLLDGVGDMLRRDPRVSEVVLDRGGGAWLVRLKP